jgi:carbamoyltransferase
LISELDAVEDVFIPPSCGDETLSFGAVAIKYAEGHEYRQMPNPLENLYLGPDVTADDVESTFGSGQLDSEFELERPPDPAERVAELLADGEIVARCYGPVEFGARALGNRSIFADPSRPEVVGMLNDMVKMRDFWMPFAPIMKQARQGDYLINKKSLRSPFMMLGFDTRAERRPGMSAAIHPRDHSARPQILEQGQNVAVENLLDAFERRTGRAVLLNTSFNIHGDPIVANVDQAIHVLRNSGLKYLWAGQVIVRKKTD